MPPTDIGVVVSGCGGYKRYFNDSSDTFDLTHNVETDGAITDTFVGVR